MQTVDFIEGIVNLMTPELEIENVLDNGDGTQTITVCNLYWIRKFLTVTIDGNNYEVSAFDSNNKTFTIPSSPLVAVDSFTLTAPYYFHGSPMQVNNEWIVQKQDSDKYPLVYLVETLTDSFYDELDQKDKDMSLRIFFLESFSSRYPEVDAHYSETIVPLRASLDYFVELLKSDSTTLPFSYDVINRIQVGTYTTNQGETNEVFSDRLDGVEFVGTVTVLKSNDNCNC